MSGLAKSRTFRGGYNRFQTRGPPVYALAGEMAPLLVARPGAVRVPVRRGE